MLTRQDVPRVQGLRNGLDRLKMRDRPRMLARRNGLVHLRMQDHLITSSVRSRDPDPFDDLKPWGCPVWMALFLFTSNKELDLLRKAIDIGSTWMAPM